MKAISTGAKGAHVVGGPQAGQPEYLPLEVVRGEEGALWSCWKPSIRERIMLLLGSDIAVGILAHKQPPIMVRLSARRKPSAGGRP